MMKDHEKRELVDALTAVAVNYAGTQQLRERIAGVLLPALADGQCERLCGDFCNKYEVSQSALAESTEALVAAEAMISRMRAAIKMLDSQYLESGFYDCSLAALEAHDNEVRAKAMESVNRY